MVCRGGCGPTEDYYYDESDQVVELHSGTVDSTGNRSVNPAPRERELWDASYVNAPAVTELDDNSDGTRDRRLYPTWDANFNITALVADHGRAVERYVWSPYGNDPEAHNGTAAYDGATLVLNGSESYTGSADESYDWSVDGTGSDYGDFHLGFQGMRWDPDSKTFITDTRRYLPSQGTFGGRDGQGTAAYATEGMSLYQYAKSNPQQHSDPTGLCVKGQKTITVEVKVLPDGKDPNKEKGQDDLIKIAGSVGTLNKVINFVGDASNVAAEDIAGYVTGKLPSNVSDGIDAQKLAQQYKDMMNRLQGAFNGWDVFIRARFDKCVCGWFYNSLETSYSPWTKREKDPLAPLSLPYDSFGDAFNAGAQFADQLQDQMRGNDHGD